jgi:SAM-dependent methyltransferase
LKTYWEERFRKEGMIWGERPSSTVDQAIELFKMHDVTEVLVPGAGYGRNARALGAAGFRVTGVEISKTAVRLATEFDRNTQFYTGSFLEEELQRSAVQPGAVQPGAIRPGAFDGIFCFNVLHLFRRPDRMRFVAKCHALLKEDGVAFFTVFAETDGSYGKGEEVEWNTFESKPGRPAHYFTESDLREHFVEFDAIEARVRSEYEQHGEQGPHTHILRTISVKRLS